MIMFVSTLPDHGVHDYHIGNDSNYDDDDNKIYGKNSQKTIWNKTANNSSSGLAAGRYLGAHIGSLGRWWCHHGGTNNG